VRVVVPAQMWHGVRPVPVQTWEEGRPEEAVGVRVGHLLQPRS
jgi:hypothetical protein